jgi:T4 bacteriophage base plate protein
MSFPKQAISTRLIKQDSTGNDLKFRPYLVKEEKILMLAKESGEVKDIFSAIKTVLAACCQEEDFDVEKIPLFDLETLFLRLRAISVNNKETIVITDEEDGQQYLEKVDFEAIAVKFPEVEQDPIIRVGDLAIHMKYPSAAIYNDTNSEIMKKLGNGQVFDLITSCIDKVFNGDVLLSLSGDALRDFLDSLDIPTYRKMKDYIMNMPKLEYRVNYKNSLGHDRFVVFNSIVDFFFSV